jgi:hypothetical protein
MGPVLGRRVLADDGRRARRADGQRCDAEHVRALDRATTTTVTQYPSTIATTATDTVSYFA